MVQAEVGIHEEAEVEDEPNSKTSCFLPFPFPFPFPFLFFSSHENIKSIMHSDGVFLGRGGGAGGGGVSRNPISHIHPKLLHILRLHFWGGKGFSHSPSHSHPPRINVASGRF